MVRPKTAGHVHTRIYWPVFGAQQSFASYPNDAIRQWEVGDYLSQADNVDVTDANRLRRRSGWQKKLDGKHVRSLFALDDSTDLVADYDKLYRLTLQGDTLLRDAVLSGLSTHAAVSYAQGAGEVFLSDGAGLWSYKGECVVAVRIPIPSRLPKLSCQADGSLAQGLYQVAITHIRSDGQESGTGGTVQAADPVNGVLVIDHLPSSVSAGVTHIGVYVSSANGNMLFLQDVMPVGTSSLRLPLLADGARRCLTHRLQLQA
ncbi:hypothetical protein [Comamonas sp. NoAH]|uniref:hypothetical protein n=1 Tax=Comamonas halotolerans TaxID=3041496 RepID=UPI0024E0C48D|nr:hypothetical protein [Comamonas sp. NoAH]